MRVSELVKEDHRRISIVVPAEAGTQSAGHWIPVVHRKDGGAVSFVRRSSLSG